MPLVTFTLKSIFIKALDIMIKKQLSPEQDILFIHFTFTYCHPKPNEIVCHKYWYNKIPLGGNLSEKIFHAILILIHNNDACCSCPKSCTHHYSSGETNLSSLWRSLGTDSQILAISFLYRGNVKLKTKRVVLL